MSDHKQREPFPPRWAFLVLAVLILGALSFMVYDKLVTTADKNTAQANSQSLAQDIQSECSGNSPRSTELQRICDALQDKAEAVQQNPTEALPPPKGDPGNDGAPGKDSTIPGPAGKDGTAGKDSTAPGPPGNDSLVPGPPGRDGADSTVPGPAGKDSTVPGPSGADSTVPGPGGPQGEQGRGIADTYCQDNGLWQITYTDGAVDSDAGRCRAAGPVEVKP